MALRKKTAFAALGALAGCGIVGAVALSKRQSLPCHSERSEESSSVILSEAKNPREARIEESPRSGQPYQPSPERLARREIVDRENMAAIYAAKPESYKKAKRAFDVVLSGAAIVALSPVFAITAGAIAAEDGLPVFYKSTRPGKDMVPFDMLKFRSMYKDADQKLKDLLAENEQTGAAFKIKDDPRITKVGRFIRKYSIDELPQLVNILKGDMSIVGPRAIVPTHEFNDHEKQRHVVTPGLTCYWQVNGRTRIPWDEWVEMDLDYIQDMSLLTDAKLIADTVPVVFGGDGE